MNPTYFKKDSESSQSINYKNFRVYYNTGKINTGICHHRHPTKCILNISELKKVIVISLLNIFMDNFNIFSCSAAVTWMAL